MYTPDYVSMFDGSENVCIVAKEPCMHGPLSRDISMRTKISPTQLVSLEPVELSTPL